MKIFVFTFCLIFAYFVSSLNPAIILSNLIYKKDIRTLGSKNPGFTNFMRVFGKKYAWFVFVLDILKSVVIYIVCGALFKHINLSRELGVAYSCFFALMGHAYPAEYKFKGGKGFLVCLAATWFMDFKAGIIATAILVIVLLTLKYMSLATLLALIGGAAACFIFKVNTTASIIFSINVLFVVIRHRQNIKRLILKTEPKFSFNKSK